MIMSGRGCQKLGQIGEKIKTSSEKQVENLVSNVLIRVISLPPQEAYEADSVFSRVVLALSQSEIQTPNVRNIWAS